MGVVEGGGGCGRGWVGVVESGVYVVEGGVVEDGGWVCRGWVGCNRGGGWVW